MFCSKCGSKVNDNDRFCWNCGNSVLRDADSGIIEKSSITSETVTEKPVIAEKTVVAEKPMVTEKPPVNRRLSVAEVDQLYDIDKLPSKEETGIKRIYIIDFITRMVSKSNIPLFIYLILNVVLIGFVVTLLFTLPVVWGMFCGLILYIASISIALSPIGEAILRHQTGCKKIEEVAVIERLYPIFREVYYKAKQSNPMISDDVRMFMTEDMSPNAFATGRKTVVVTRGLLSRSDEEIRAALGHEFGHLSHKDTDRILVVGIGNTVITSVAVMIQIGAIITEFIGYIVAIFTGDDEGWLIGLFSTLSRIITMFIINVFMKIWNMIGIALCMKTSRNNEYEADEFSVRLGYADGLVSLLSFLGGKRPKGLFASLASSHPASADRIARIKAISTQMNTEE